MHALGLLALLAPFVAAKGHQWCGCGALNEKGEKAPNAQLTEWVCLKSYKGQAVFDADLKRCVATPGNTIDNGIFGSDCQDAATNGFYPILGDVVDDSKPALTAKSPWGRCPWPPGNGIGNGPAV
ncbi:hypothetical protein E4U13_001976 [Claviceps humidiphila]|uniref:Uncharacterized protein n=1 Tax=Claviceps humidiphila TaxID=1294629 RepID=A0A9P7Q2V3_9HYPO|nr:hypothetical protein E4U13_001976 [Claviceps humidiphila]